MTSNVFIDKSPPSLGPKQSMVIFEDSDSDGGNIFGSTTNKGVGPTAKTSTISPTIHTLTSRSTKLTAKPNTMHSNDGEKKIFGDDSSDDDLGLFSGDRKNKSALNQSKAETVKGRPKQMPSKKLFSDSDDDDLFSGSLKSEVHSSKCSSVHLTNSLQTMTRLNSQDCLLQQKDS